MPAINDHFEPAPLPGRISRDRLDSLVADADADATANASPGSPATARYSLRAIATVVTLGGLLFGYDTGVIAGALPFMTDSVASGGLGLTPVTEGLVTSSLLFGAAFGALYGGRLSDRYGRRHNLLGLAGIFVVGAVGTAFAPNIAVMVAARIVLGLAVGGASSTVPVYLAEIAPQDLRGRLVAVDALMIVTGQLLAFTTNAVMANVWDGHSTWRWMLLVASLPAIAMWIGMHFVPETARWYAGKGRVAEAAAVLRGTRPVGADIAAELGGVLAVAEESAGRAKGGWADLATPWIKRVVVIGVGIAMVQQLTGINTLMYYAPTILTTTGLGTDTALTATIANGVVSVIASAVGLWLVGRLPRRRLLIIGQVGIIASLLAISTTFRLLVQPGLEAGTTPPAVGSYTVLAFMLGFLLFQQGAVSPVTWVMLSEVFPLRMRGFGMGVAVFAMWIINAVISFSFPVLISTFGGAGTFLVFAAINVGTLVFTWRMVPETGHLTLEELEADLRLRLTAG